MTDADGRFRVPGVPEMRRRSSSSRRKATASSAGGSNRGPVGRIRSSPPRRAPRPPLRSAASTGHSRRGARDRPRTDRRGPEELRVRRYRGAGAERDSRDHRPGRPRSGHRDDRESGRHGRARTCSRPWRSASPRSDPRKALEFLDAIGEPELGVVRRPLSLFDRLGATGPPEFRRELLDRAERRAPRDRSIPARRRANLARVADRWFDLGDVDHGVELVREAQAPGGSTPRGLADNRSPATLP